MNKNFENTNYQQNKELENDFPFDLSVMNDNDVIGEGRILAAVMLFEPLRDWTRLELIEANRMSKEEVERGLLALIDNKYVKIINVKDRVLYSTQPMWEEELFNEYRKNQED